MKHKFLTPERPQHKKLIEFAGSFAVAVEHRRIVIAAKKNKRTVKSRRKASVKTVKRKGTNQRKRKKIMATTREPNIQSTECDPNKTWSPQKRDRFTFKFFALMYFNSSWPELSFIDMMTNSLLEIWNLVWTKPQTGQATTKGFAIYIIVPGHNKSSPFSSALVSYEILSKGIFDSPWSQ